MQYTPTGFTRGNLVDTFYLISTSSYRPLYPLSLMTTHIQTGVTVRFSMNLPACPSSCMRARVRVCVQFTDAWDLVEPWWSARGLDCGGIDSIVTSECVAINPLSSTRIPIRCAKPQSVLCAKC